MGRSTVNQLIQRAKSMNDYNNSGVANDFVWTDHFDSALVEMVDDLDIQETFTIDYTPNKALYDLPSDYYSLLSIKSEYQQLKPKRSIDDRSPGYWIYDRGHKHEIDITFSYPIQLTGLYQRYPKPLDYSQRESQKPEVPTVGENALCYKAIHFALLNNNQPGQAQYYDELYRKELANIRTATVRARGQ